VGHPLPVLVPLCVLWRRWACVRGAARRRSPALLPNDGFGLSRPRSVNRGGTSKKSLTCRHGTLGYCPERVTTPPQAKKCPNQPKINAAANKLEKGAGFVGID